MSFFQPTATIQDEYKRISMKDPAVDSECENFNHKWELYLEGSQEPPLKDGAEPVVWTLRHVKAKARARYQSIYAGEGAGDANLFLARYALIGVTAPGAGEVEVPRETDKGLDLVSMDFMDDLELARQESGADLVTEIVSWALQAMNPS